MSVTDINGTLFSATNATCDKVGLNLERQPDADVAGIGVGIGSARPDPRTDQDLGYPLVPHPFLCQLGIRGCSLRRRPDQR